MRTGSVGIFCDLLLRGTPNMCKGFSIFFVSLLASIAAISQVPAPTPTPVPGQRPVPPVLDDNNRYDRLRSIDLINERRQGKPDHPLLDSKKGIYRRPGKEETAALAVGESLLKEHETFLQQPDTGIVKLNSDSACASNSEVVNVREECLQFRMPGAGIAFSFRTDSYRLPRLADLMFLDGYLRADAVLQQVIMTELADVPLGSVTLQTPGMKYLAEFKPPPDGDGFLAYDRELAAGIDKDGFRYRKGFLARSGVTYAIRSVAYKGSYFRSIDGVTYDELEYDRRRDVVVAFRIVDRDAAGNITILWKRLRETNSPTLKIRK